MPLKRRERRRRRTGAGLQQHRSQRGAIDQTRRSTDPEFVMDPATVTLQDEQLTVRVTGHYGSTVIDYSGEDLSFEQTREPTNFVAIALRRQPTGTRHVLVPVVLRRLDDMLDTRGGW